jgi:hypothetical protein
MVSPDCKAGGWNELSMLVRELGKSRLSWTGILSVGQPGSFVCGRDGNGRARDGAIDV